MQTIDEPDCGSSASARAQRLLFLAATLLVGGTATEASARSLGITITISAIITTTTCPGRTRANGSWRDANAAIPSSGTGRSFSGVASFYGDESGRRTASGQRFNENAMTCAHRSLPFGTKLG